MYLPIDFDAKDEAVWLGAIAFALAIAWQVHGHLLRKSRRRARWGRVESLAETLGMEYEADPKSIAYRELKVAYSDAKWWGKELLHELPSVGVASDGWGVAHLYRGHGFSAFEVGTWNPPVDGIALGVQIANLALPPFRRQAQYSMLITQLDRERSLGNILDLPDGSLVLLRDAGARDAIRAVFSPAVLSFLGANPDFDFAGNGDQLWLSSMDDRYGDDVETILVEGAELLMYEVKP